MEKLTHYQKNGEVAEPYNRSQAHEFAKKLAEYEDLEEQGLLVRLPCKAGDTVYILRDGKILSAFVLRIFQDISDNGIWWVRAQMIKNCWEMEHFRFDDFGKTVFLAREEAALRKMKEIGNE